MGLPPGATSWTEDHLATFGVTPETLGRRIMNDKKSSQARDEYRRFAEPERHFNQTQAGIRNLASAWMLAAFAAIALLLKADKDVQ